MVSFGPSCYPTQRHAASISTPHMADFLAHPSLETAANRRSAASIRVGNRGVIVAIEVAHGGVNGGAINGSNAFGGLFDSEDEAVNIEGLANQRNLEMIEQIAGETACGGGPRRDQQNGMPANQTWLIGNDAQHPHPAELRHHEIEQDDIRGCRGIQLFKRLLSVMRFINTKPFFLQDQPERLTDCLVIIHDEYAHLRPYHILYSHALFNALFPSLKTTLLLC